MTGPVPAHGNGTNPYEPQPYPQRAPDAAPPAPAYQEVPPDEYARIREQQQAVPALPAAAPPAAPVDDDGPDDGRPAPGEHLDDIRAEVDTEEEANAAAEDAQERPQRDIPDGAVAVPLEGLNGRDVIHILDPRDWSTAANGDLRVGDFESWAAECLAPGDYEEVWQALDPRMRHVEAMFKEYRRVTGQDRGKSPRSMAGLRRMGRR